MFRHRPTPQSPQRVGELEESHSFLGAGEADPARGECAGCGCLSAPLQRAAQSCAGDAGRGTEEGHSGRKAGSKDSRVGGRTAWLPSPGPGSIALKQEAELICTKNLWVEKRALGRLAVCSGGLFCTLQDAQQRPWPLSPVVL